MSDEVAQPPATNDAGNDDTSRATTAPLTGDANDEDYPAFRYAITDTPSVVWHIIGFSQPSAIVAFTRVNKRASMLCVMDAVWKDVLPRWHFSQLMPLPFASGMTIFEQFAAHIGSLSMFDGTYSFQAEDELDTTYNLSSATFLVTKASLGFQGPLRRVRLDLRFTSGATESYDGTMRFSFEKNMFAVATCQVVMSGATRAQGPRLNGVVATHTKPFANQSRKQFEAHRGGLRFILTVGSLPPTPGRALGSSITANEVIGVSKPPVHWSGSSAAASPEAASFGSPSSSPPNSAHRLTQGPNGY